MSAPDGYRVTLECGHRTSPTPTIPAAEGYCEACGRFQPVRYITNPGGHRVPHVVPADYAPPALRSRWVRVLSRVPGLSRLVDAISGPWTGGDDDG